MAILKKMKIGKKVLTLSLALGLITSSFAMPAFAERQAYSFDVSLSTEDGVAFSSGNYKNDNVNSAYVRTQDGNLASNDWFYFSVFNTPRDISDYRVTGYELVTSNDTSVDLEYRASKNVSYGDTLYLQGDTDKYSCRVSGYWYA